MDPFALLSSIAGAAGSQAGLSDSGLTNTTSTNIVGNFNANLGEILRELNTGSSVNGGYPTIFSSPMSMLGRPAVDPGTVLQVSGPGFSLGIGGMVGLAAAALGLFLLLK